jgi:uncharacterized membrane protein YfcA
MKFRFGAMVAGAGAGALNGLFGAGGGMVLAPLLGLCTDLRENQIFPCSVVILFPICIVSLLFADGWAAFSFVQALPYLLGSLLGGIGTGIWGKKVPVL